MPELRTQPPQIWCFMDGKPGHENQMLGLVEALIRKLDTPPEVHEFRVSTRYHHRLVGGGLERDDRERLSQLPPPQLLLGAGHSTHLPLWRARKRWGGRAIVLMKPSLPLRLFDLCLIPDAHDLRSPPNNVLLTRGVLNRVQPSHTHDSSKAICLLGGPSQHFTWDNAHITSQLADVIAASPELEWTIASSRRTPVDLLDDLSALLPSATIVPHHQVTRDWLPEQLGENGTIWVSEDSVSMTYEAVTSGAQVGILQLTRPRSTRVTRGVDRLIESHCVTSFSTWQSTHNLYPGRQDFFESDRAAEEILQRFLPQLPRKAIAA